MDIKEWIKNVGKLNTDLSYIPTDEETQKARNAMGRLLFNYFLLVFYKFINIISYMETPKHVSPELRQEVIEKFNLDPLNINGLIEAISYLYERNNKLEEIINEIKRRNGMLESVSINNL